MRVVTSFVGSGPSHCVLVLGCAGAAADAPAGLLCPASLAGGSSAAGSTLVNLNSAHCAVSVHALGSGVFVGSKPSHCALN